MLIDKKIFFLWAICGYLITFLWNDIYVLTSWSFYFSS